jgi:ATP-dependent Clp protease ATP-binding subunit ClpA
MPEFLGRVGFPEGVVVFDFISPNVAKGIFDMLLHKQLSDISSKKGLSLSISEDARGNMADECSRDLDLGGRGIREKFKVVLTEPLSEAILSSELDGGDWRITRWRKRANGFTLDLERGGEA